MSKGIEVRWLVIAAIAACSSLGVYAAEPLADEATVAAEVPAPYADAAVVITPVPMPASVIEVLQPINRSSKLRSAKKLNLAKKESFPATLLSRTERHQLALLSARAKPGDPPRRKYFNDENGEAGYDELVLHRSYSRPRLATEAEEESDDALDPQLSKTVRLRLFLARMKAVEAHALAQVNDTDDDLPAAVKERLQMARQKAVQAHQKKFS